MDTKKRKLKWTTSYSNIPVEDAERRLCLRLSDLVGDAENVIDMIDKESITYEILDIKEKVYERMSEFLNVEGYPTMTSNTFKEANVNDLVATILIPIISDFKQKSNRKNIRLYREKEIISTDSQVGGIEEFVVVDTITITEERFIFVIEAKRTNLGDAMKQCLLSMKDMYETNQKDLDMYNNVYGFLTTGDSWQFVIYDGEHFKISEDFKAMFPKMRDNRDRWLRDYSTIVDCMFQALSG